MPEVIIKFVLEENAQPLEGHTLESSLHEALETGVVDQYANYTDRMITGWLSLNIKQALLGEPCPDHDDEDCLTCAGSGLIWSEYHQ